MNVLFVGPNLASGGAERQLTILLPALRRRGYDARLLLLDGGGPFLEPLERAGVPLEILHMRHQFDLARLARSRLLRSFRPQAVVSRGVSGLYVAHAVARWRRARHFFNEHRQVGLAVSPRRETMIRLLAPRLDLVIAVTAEQCPTWLARGCRRDQLAVVPNGVLAHAVSDPPAAIREDLGIADDAVVAVHVASLRPEKQVADFVTAVRRARSTRPELVGLVVGEGPDRPAVERAAGGDPGVRLLGLRTDVPRILAAADIFVSASAYEALPMAILEAMAARLPVLATDVGGVGEIVDDGTTGLLVAPRAPEAMAARLLELAADPARRRALGEAGARRQAERWGAEAMVDGYARLLDGARGA